MPAGAGQAVADHFSGDAGSIANHNAMRAYEAYVQARAHEEIVNHNAQVASAHAASARAYAIKARSALFGAMQSEYNVADALGFGAKPVLDPTQTFVGKNQAKMQTFPSLQSMSIVGIPIAMMCNKIDDLCKDDNQEVKKINFL